MVYRGPKGDIIINIYLTVLWETFVSLLSYFMLHLGLGREIELEHGVNHEV